MIVTPLFSSPLITAHWIGAAPLYLGKSEACTLTQPNLGSSRISLLRIWPNAATTIMSGASSRRRATASGRLTLTGENTGIPHLSAHSCTGVLITPRPRPLGLSGCVTARLTSQPFLIIVSSTSAARSGVPINTIFKFCLLWRCLRDYCLSSPASSSAFAASSANISSSSSLV